MITTNRVVAIQSTTRVWPTSSFYRTNKVKVTKQINLLMYFVVSSVVVLGVNWIAF